MDISVDLTFTEMNVKRGRAYHKISFATHITFICTFQDEVSLSFLSTALRASQAAGHNSRALELLQAFTKERRKRYASSFLKKKGYASSHSPMYYTSSPPPRSDHHERERERQCTVGSTVAATRMQAGRRSRPMVALVRVHSFCIFPGSWPDLPDASPVPVSNSSSMAKPNDRVRASAMDAFVPSTPLLITSFNPIIISGVKEGKGSNEGGNQVPPKWIDP